MRIVAEAPIVEVTHANATAQLEVFANRCQAFGLSLAEHGSEVIHRPNRPDFPIAASAHNAAGMAEEDEEGECLLFDGLGAPDHHLFAYMLGSAPVGMMLCGGDLESYEHLEALACNPGLSGCGGALIERAVELSMDNGRGGRVALYGHSEELKQIYLSYGFVLKDVGTANLVIDPTSSSRWHLISTPAGLRYRLIPKLQYIGD